MYVYIILFFLVLFIWINKPTPSGFCFILQNNWIKGRVVGVENFNDGEPLSLQLEVSSLMLVLSLYNVLLYITICIGK